MTSPQYYILTGSPFTFTHSAIVAADCQASYSATFRDTAGNFAAGSALSSLSLLNYNDETRTLTLEGTGDSLVDTYHVSFESTLASCSETQLNG